MDLTGAPIVHGTTAVGGGAPIVHHAGAMSRAVLPLTGLYDADVVLGTAPGRSRRTGCSDRDAPPTRSPGQVFGIGLG